MILKIPDGFTPRQYQLPVLKALDSGMKRAVVCWHRRSGKDLTLFNYMIKRMVVDRGVYFYVFPTYKQGKKVIWDNITIDGKKYLDFIPKQIIERVNNVEMKITLFNGSLIQVVGSNDYDALMGTNPRGIIFSEYALQDKQAWEYIRPILSVNKGWAVFVSTPRGKNHFHEMFNIAKDHPDDWFSELLTIEDTGVLSIADLKKEGDFGMSDHMIQQEYYCDFNVGSAGSYYSKDLFKAEEEERIGFVPIDENIPVNTAWDLGVSDSTCIIFFQLHGLEIRIVDYYEHHGEGLQHYAKVLDKKGYLYGEHYAPHDIEVRELGNWAISRRETAKGLGIKFRVVKNIPITEGIEAVWTSFPRMFFDKKKCNHLLKCLEAYRRDYDESRDVYIERPYHDFSSHAADAMRYMAIAIQQFQGYKSMTEEQAHDLENKYYNRI